MDPAAGIGIAIGMTPRIGTAIGIAIGMTTGMAFGWGPTAGVQLPKLTWSSPVSVQIMPVTVSAAIIVRMREKL